MSSPYGHKIVDGVLRYESVTGIEKADPHTKGGCFRKWHYDYIAKIKPEKTEQQQAGTDLHAENDRYLTTGVKTLGKLALTGVTLLPAPGPDLHVEYEISGKPPLSAPTLFAAGVPIVGKIDLMHDRGGKVLGLEYDLHDPPGTPTVHDHKTTGIQKKDLDRYLTRREELPEKVQMSGYGKVAFATYPDAEQVRLSHGYYFTKFVAPARLVTIRVDRERVERRWSDVETTVRTLKDIVREQDSTRVDANTASCDAYRRRDGSGGCPYRSICPSAMADADPYSFLFGVPAEPDPLIAAFTQPTGDHDMGIMEKIDTSALDADIDALLAEEDAATKAANTVKVPQPFRDAIASLKANPLKVGFPTLSGDAADLYSQMMRETSGANIAKGTVHNGEGKLAAKNFSSPADVIAVAGQLKAKADSSGLIWPKADAPKPAAPEVQVAPSVTLAPPPDVAVEVKLLPPDAPASKPELAALPLETQPVVAPAPTVAEVAAAAPEAQVTAAVEEAKAKRTRAKKESTAEAKASATVTESTLADKPVGTVLTVTNVGAQVYVNCIPTAPFTDLRAHVAAVAAELAARAEAHDIRLSKKDTLDFGRWKAALEVALRTRPPEAGVYYLDASSEFGAIAAEAYADRVIARGR